MLVKQLKLKKISAFKILPLIIVTIISIIVAFINPYGIDAIKYLFNSYGVSKINLVVNEMKNISISTPFGKMAYLMVLFMLYSFYRNKTHNKVRFVFLALGVIYLTLSHYKGLTFLAIICPFVLSYNFRKKDNNESIKIALYEKIVYIFLLILMLSLTLFRVQLDDDVDIKEFADYLDENASVNIKLFTDYNDGGYMEYRGYKCYIDPRAEVFLKNNNRKEDIFDEYYKLENNEIDINEFLNKYQFDYLLVNDRLKQLLMYLQNSDEYSEVLSKIINKNEDNKEFLFKKIDNDKANENSH